MTRRRGTHQRAFTLLSVLVAIFIFAFGILGILRSIAGITAGATQNQNVNAIASLSNGFWGVVQSNPSLVTTAAFANTVTYNASNIASAPAVLQPWLYSLTDTASGLPAGTAAITTYPDEASGQTCATTSGCTMQLVLTWTQVASNGNAAATRSQTFYYQFGL